MEKTSVRCILMGTYLAIGSLIVISGAYAADDTKTPPESEQIKALDSTQTGECEDAQPSASQPQDSKDAAEPPDQQIAMLNNRNMPSNMGNNTGGSTQGNMGNNMGGGTQGNMGNNTGGGTQGNMGGGIGTGTGIGGMGTGGLSRGPCTTGTSSSSSTSGGG